MQRFTAVGRAVLVVLALTMGYAQSATNAGAAPGYEQVSQVMKSVFSSGDLSPTSRAVKHAADVDMPARGGNPQALKQYLMKPDVKKWYQQNFQLK